jgi:hypothetical protein
MPMAQHPRLAFAAWAAAWALLAAATLWNARENQALRAELGLLRQQQAALEANMRADARPPAAPVPTAAAPLPAQPAPPLPAARAKLPAPPASAPVTLEEALARWREAPARAAANPFGTP